MRAFRVGYSVRAGAMAVATPLFATALLAGGQAQAATIQVKLGCSLTQAISAANGDVVVGTCTKGSGHDDVVLGAGNYNVSAALEIWSDVTIRGAGLGATTITSSNVNAPSFALGMGECNSVPAAVYINAIGASADGALPVRFKDLTLRPAAGTINQGICEQAGHLWIDQARVTGFQEGGLWIENNWTVPSHLDLVAAWIDFNVSNSHGGGIYFKQWDYPSAGVGGQFTISRSTISNNFSAGFGGGIYFGQVNSENDINIGHNWNRVTISNNGSLGDGGGLYDDMQHSGSYLTLKHSTVADNYSSGRGGGIAKVWAPTAGVSDLSFQASIVHANESAEEAATNNLTYPISGNAAGWRLHCDDSHLFLEGSAWTPERLPSNGNGTCVYTVADLKLAGLAGKGGLNNLPVHELLSGSPAIDSAPANEFSTDARGVATPIDGDLDVSKVADRGAYEYVPFETENLIMAAKSANVTHNTLTGTAYAAYSNSGGTNLQSNAISQYVVYQTPSVPAGTYKVIVRHKKASNAGRFLLSRANTLSDAVNGAGSHTTMGFAIDGYAATDTWVDHDLGNFSIGSTGVKYFRLKVTGKHSSSSSYRLFPDTISLIRQ